MVHLSLLASLPPFVGKTGTPGLFQGGFAGSSKWFHRAETGWNRQNWLRLVKSRLPLGDLRTTSVRRKLAFQAREAPGRQESMKMTRRGLLGAASAAWATTILNKPASAAAEFEFK